MAQYDPIREFHDTPILQQGILAGFVFDPPKIELHFEFPKRFEIHFIRVENYRVNLSLSPRLPVKQWSARRDSEYLAKVVEETRRMDHRGRDLSSLCHFRVEFQGGDIDVLADDAVFMMVAR